MSTHAFSIFFFNNYIIEDWNLLHLSYVIIISYIHHWFYVYIHHFVCGLNFLFMLFYIPISGKSIPILENRSQKNPKMEKYYSLHHYLMQPLLQQLVCPLILDSLVSDIYPSGSQAQRTLPGEITRWDNLSSLNWPLRSNINLGLKTIRAITISSQDTFTVFFHEAQALLGHSCQKGHIPMAIHITAEILTGQG